MARYDREHKAATRQRIIETAGRRLKREGVERSGIVGLMADVGLTNGAFYAHFASKDDLVATVVADQLSRQRDRTSAGMTSIADFRDFVRDYLSPEHRDHTEEGCPSAAMLEDIGRSADVVRETYTAGMVAMIDDFAALLGEPDHRVAKARALSIFAAMTGVLQVSRVVTDEALARDVLQQGVANTLALLDVLVPSS